MTEASGVAMREPQTAGGGFLQHTLLKTSRLMSDLVSPTSYSSAILLSKELVTL